MMASCMADMSSSDDDDITYGAQSGSGDSIT